MSKNATTPVAFRRLLLSLRDFLKDRFTLQDDKASTRETIDYIEKGVIFRGTSLWILMFAIMIASVGLNVNSTAVIIGAMLISPLMGPIMGIGLGVGINDFELIIRALKNLGIAAGISILTSAVYFFITPLQAVNSELLARTTPTLWDVLIGLFGGLAGIVAGSRKEKSNAIPGVAIATALMPPLCTAGYGLATGQLQYFIGAFYLFFINSVFISLSTFLIVRALKFPRKEFMDHERESRVKRYIAIFVFLTIVPSLFTAYRVVRRSVFEQKANQFINQEFMLGSKTQIINQKVSMDGGHKVIEVTLIGDPLNPDVENLIRARMMLPDYRLSDADLVINQSYQGDDLDLATIQEMNQQLRVGIIEDLYKKNEEMLKNKDSRIRLLEEEIVRLKSREMPVLDMASEVKAINNNIAEFSCSPTLLAHTDSLTADTSLLVFARFKRRPTKKEVTQLEDWVKARTKNDKVRLVTE